jgi:hypothetical protein
MKFQNKPDLVFLCNTRDFHAMDWVRSFKELCGYEPVIFTETRSGEGLKDLSKDYQLVHNLFIIDFFLFSNQNKFNSTYRNFLKILLIPLQIIIFKIKIKRFKLHKSIFHCHGMYYSLLASLSGVKFISTPQGSEILIRYYSFLYRTVADFIFKKSFFVTVDSISMKKKINKLFKKKVYVIQNGIDIDLIKNIKLSSNPKRKNAAISPRGMTSLYRIKEIIFAFNSLKNNLDSIDFCYPFFDINYLKNIKKINKCNSKYFGQLQRAELIKKYLEYKYVISIPTSDSSPRSVYEAVICGCIVIVQYNDYLLQLPKLIKNRIIAVDIKNPNWLEEALQKAKACIPFNSIDLETKIYIDQKYQMKKILNIVNEFNG